MEYTYTIEGMTCNNCKKSVEEKLSSLSKINKVSVDLNKKIAVIEADQFIPLSKLSQALPSKYSIKTTGAEQEETSSKLKQLRPLFLIFAYITSASILMHYSDFKISAFLADFMGLFFIVFSFFKFLDIKGFATSFSMYDPIAKRVNGYGQLYPFIELALGLAFLFRWNLPIALIGTLLVLGITTIGVVRVLRSKSTIKCACLGSVLNLPMTEATFIENALMIGMSIVMLLSYV